ncbi:MAG: hypothetical protein M1820_001546 [Bogoriella megaspora]|nr:MAG: hypothetical protein M1820_001546 [Bogoriella megaspora]
MDESHEINLRSDMSSEASEAEGLKREAHVRDQWGPYRDPSSTPLQSKGDITRSGNFHPLWLIFAIFLLLSGVFLYDKFGSTVQRKFSSPTTRAKTSELVYELDLLWTTRLPSFKDRKSITAAEQENALKDIRKTYFEMSKTWHPDKRRDLPKWVSEQIWRCLAGLKEEAETALLDIDCYEKKCKSSEEIIDYLKSVNKIVDNANSVATIDAHSEKIHRKHYESMRTKAERWFHNFKPWWARDMRHTTAQQAS